jgi:hypothetical protein
MIHIVIRLITGSIPVTRQIRTLGLPTFPCRTILGVLFPEASHLPGAKALACGLCRRGLMYLIAVGVFC